MKYTNIYIWINKNLLNKVLNSEENMENTLIIDEFWPWWWVTEFWEIARHSFLELSRWSWSFASILGRVRLRKQKIKNKLSTDFLKSRWIDFIKWKALQIDKTSIEINWETIKADKVEINKVSFSESEVELFNLSEKPDRIAIIGWGKKSLELAEWFANCWCIVEIFVDEFLQNFDEWIKKWVEKYFAEKWVKISKKEALKEDKFDFIAEINEDEDELFIDLNMQIISYWDVTNNKKLITLESNILANLSMQENWFIALYFDENNILKWYSLASKNALDISVILNEFILENKKLEEIKNTNFPFMSILKSLNEKL